MRWPLVRSVRKWTPAKILLSVASLLAAEKLVNERVAPGRTSEVTTKSKSFFPKKEFSTDAAAALMTACTPGYDGSGVVLVTSGSQLWSASVPRFPLVPLPE
jgi:hypothetical protein